MPYVIEDDSDPEMNQEILGKDSHLLDVDHLRLKRVLEQFDLEPPAIQSPPMLLKKFSH